MVKRFDVAATRRSPSVSRRVLLGYGAAFTATMLGGADGVRAQQKRSKEDVQYQESPKDDQKCADCRFFIEGGSCQLVEGEISPNGWCMLFQPKT